MDELIFDTIRIPREHRPATELAGSVSRHHLALVAALDGGMTEADDCEDAFARAYTGAFESLLEIA